MTPSPWAAFLAITGFEALLRDLTQHTLTEARRAWPGAPAGFAFNCSAAWSDVHISLAYDPARAAMEPPDWEHECAEAELPASAALWRARYEPVRERYEAERERHANYPKHFLDTLRHLLARMERDGAFADAPGIRLLVTEVDADTAAEEAALAQVRRNHGTPT
ncbi:hypothetical protein GmRootA79_53420 (plasmid) [Acidovorax sp. A79]|uniref:hypothetical protein n=1 Tax=Acidovorax sp. A79 TaxID=3056107 RepID=UPI0034E8E8BD